MWGTVATVALVKESASTALSYLKAHAEHLGIDPEVFEKNDIHIHIPEGAIPKCLASRLTSRPTSPAAVPG